MIGVSLQAPSAAGIVSIKFSKLRLASLAAAVEEAAEDGGIHEATKVIASIGRLGLALLKQKCYAV